MAGEQTFMKSRKTAGRITNFAFQLETVQKQVLNQPSHARLEEAMLQKNNNNNNYQPKKLFTW